MAAEAAALASMPTYGLAWLAVFSLAFGVDPDNLLRSEEPEFSAIRRQLMVNDDAAPSNLQFRAFRGSPLSVDMDSFDRELQMAKLPVPPQEDEGELAGQMARAIFGSSDWPPPGEHSWPPAEANTVSNGTEGRRAVVEGYAELTAIVVAILCCGVAVSFHGREAASVAAAVAASSKTPLASARIAGRADMGPSVGAWPAPGPAAQFWALSAAVCWRHSHRKALLHHLLRLALPTLSLVLMHYARGYLSTEFAKPEWKALLKGLGGTTPAHAVDALLEYWLTVMMLFVALSCMTNFVWHVSTESESGFRRLLHVSGLSRIAYLAAIAGVDGVMQTLVGLGVMALLAGAVLRLRMVIWTSPALLALLFVVLALTAVLLGYVLHFPFKTARSSNTLAQVVVMIVMFTAPFVPLNAVVPLISAGQSWRTLALPVLPAHGCLFELARGCAKGRCLMLRDLVSAWTQGAWVSPGAMIVGVHEVLNPTPPDAIICLLGLIAVQLAVGWSFVVLMDVRNYPALHKVAEQPLAGAVEEASAAVLEVQGLVHSYDGWISVEVPGSSLVRQLSNQEETVVNGVSFEVAAGATLGLLGPNGAGKTTTIRCITGEEVAKHGTVSIRLGARGPARIGLCPQETVLSEDLTVSENILLFANIRGLSGPAAGESVVKILRATCLEEKHDWLPGTLSGGMRRRLAVGCAMVGSPAVAILDEPTTGLDPLSRRGIWSTLGEIKAAGGCCLLTTHMLEEAEALCTNLVILRKGQIAAEGSVQQLKEEWGTGYVLSVDCNLGDEDRALSCVAALLPESCREPVKVAAQGQMTFKVPGDAQMVGRLFIELAGAAEAGGIRRWGISQASLEDAYLRIIQEDMASPRVD